MNIAAPNTPWSTRAGIDAKTFSLSQWAFDIAQLGGEATNLAEFCQSVTNHLDQLLPAKSALLTLNHHPLSNLVWRKQDKCVLAPLERELTRYLIDSKRSQCLQQKAIKQFAQQNAIACGDDLPTSQLGLILPSKNKGPALGVLVLQSFSEYHFTQDDLEALEQLAPFIAQAIEHVLARPDNPNRADKMLSVLYRITDLTQSKAPLLEIYSGLHSSVSEVIAADNFFIAHLDKHNQRLEFPFIHNEKGIRSPSRQLTNGLTEYLLQQGKPLLLREEELEQLYQRGTINNNCGGTKCWLGVPLEQNGEQLGALVVQDYRNSRRYDEEDLRLIDYLGHHVSSLMGWRRVTERLEQNKNALQQAVFERTQELEREINERRRIESQLRHDTLHDGLTCLPNRTMMMQRLHKVIAVKQRNPNFNYALLFMDLNRFKVINDSLGHLTGDRLLTQVAKRLNSCIRESDTVARLGGDEFAILLEHLSDHSDALQSADRIQSVLTKPFHIDGEEIYSGCSIGIAFGLPQYNTPVELLRDADVAMYRAKQSHRPTPVVFDDSMREAAQQRMRLENELQRALELEQFVVFYQPIWRLDTEQLVGFEALVRWQHPKLGLLAPIHFIETMMETRQILALDRWVLNQACHQFASWQKKYPRLKKTNISVNLSSDWFSRADSLDVVMQCVKQAGISPHSLKLEITESSLLHHQDQAAEILSQFRDKGVHLMMDDFGTGYSSLSYLHRLPLDVVKIDRSFISRIHSDPRSEAVITAIYHLAEALGMKITAEGIDDPAQIAVLKKIGCHFGQGYHLGHPIPHEKISDFVSGKCAIEDTGNQ